MSKDRILGTLDESLKSRASSLYSTFRDWSFRDYFYQAFVDDYRLQKDIQLAGYMLEKEELSDRIARMEKPYTENASPESTPASEYEKLSMALTNYADRVAKGNAAEDAWKKIDKNVINYFSSGWMYSGLVLYKDMEDENKKPKELAYYLNTKSKTLRYWDPKDQDYHDVCTFHDNTEDGRKRWEDVQTLFPEIFKPTKTINISQRYDRLDPLRFIDLISLAKENTKNATFHLTVDNTFIPLFNNLKEYLSLEKQSKEYKDELSRSLPQLIEGIVKSMDSHIEKYLANSDNKNPDKRKIMEAIKTFLQDGDDDKFVEAVNKYDPQYSISRLMHAFSLDQADATLSVIRKLRKSKFFTPALQKLKAERDAGSAAKPVTDLANEYNPLVNPQESENKVKTFWKEAEVDKSSMLATLTKMLQALETFEPGVELPEVPLPHELQEPEVDQDALKVNDHIKQRIIKLKNQVEDAADNTYFQTNCINLEIDIDYILRPRTFTKTIIKNDKEITVNKRISEAQLMAYASLGDSLRTILHDTQMRPTPKVEVINSVSTIKKEIERLQNFYDAMRTKLEHYELELENIGQTTFSDDIAVFTAKDSTLYDRQAKLKSISDSIIHIQDKRFNVLDPKGGYQVPVIAAAKALLKLSSEPTDELVKILTPNGESRQFISPNKSKTINAEYNDKFEKLTKDIKQYVETFDAETSQLDKFFEISAPQVSTTDNRLFRTKSNESIKNNDIEDEQTPKADGSTSNPMMKGGKH